MSTRVEGALEQLAYAKGVIGVVVCTLDGVPIRDTFQDLDRSQAIHYAGIAADIIATALPLARVKGEGSVESVRVRTSSSEWIIRLSAKYMIMVVQEPTSD